jgi:hypothetical protein
MAGKTLTGIGDDESGKHELAADTSAPVIIDAPADTSEKIDQPTSARATDRMPMFAGAGSGPAVMPVVEGGLGVGFGSGSGAGVVDEDKVAEGLKKLRSLDEPLGPIPSSMPTLKEGVPVVGGAPTAPHPAAIAAAAASELLRSRGTAHGHALSVAAGGQGILVPISMDERMKGTLLGHSLHLPDVSEGGAEESRPAEIRSVSLAESPGALVTTMAATSPTGFSPGDSSFFEDEPLNTEFEPETPRSKLMAQGTIAVAGLLVVAVVIFAWVRVRSSDAPAPAPAQDNAGLPVPPSVPPPAPAAVAPPEPAAAAAPSPAPAAPEPAALPPPPPPVFPEEEPARAAVAAPPHAHTRHVSAPAPHPAPSPSHAASSTSPRAPAAPRAAASTAPIAPPHAAASTAPIAPLHAHETKPSAPGKRGKSDEDPDGTLPLTE